MATRWTLAGSLGLGVGGAPPAAGLAAVGGPARPAAAPGSTPGGRAACWAAAAGARASRLGGRALSREGEPRVPGGASAGARVPEGTRRIVHAGVPDGGYRAFDRRTGKELWR